MLWRLLELIELIHKSPSKVGIEYADKEIGC